MEFSGDARAVDEVASQAQWPRLRSGWFGLYSDKASHFITRYTLKNHSDIFVYDGMKNNGYSMRLDKKASFATHLAGNNQGFPGGYKVSAAIYHL